MATDLFAFLNWMADRGWIGPLMGLSVFGAALVFGRRLLQGARPALAMAAGPVAEPDGPLRLTTARYINGVPRDRRAAPRRRGSTVEVRLDDGSGCAPAPGWVIDRSAGGLGLLSVVPAEVGAVLRVRAKEAPEVTPWVEITVRSCRQVSGQFEMGCQFRRTPDWNLMMQFG